MIFSLIKFKIDGQVTDEQKIGYKIRKHMMATSNRVIHIFSNF